MAKRFPRFQHAETAPVGFYRRYFYILHTGHPFSAGVRSVWAFFSLPGVVLIATGTWISLRRWRRKKAMKANAVR